MSAEGPSQAEPNPIVARGAREHFIPLATDELLRRLLACSELQPGERQELARLSRLLAATIHYEFHGRLEQLKAQYRPLDPDDELTGPAVTAGTGDEPLFSQLAELAERANYRLLGSDELRAAIDAASHWGLRLHVDLQAFSRLAVYVRGNRFHERTLCNWRTWYRRVPVAVPVYRRLLVVYRLRRPQRGSLTATEAVYLKHFKNIPHDDVDMLLPESRVKMTWLDQGRILFPTVSGLGLALFKLAKVGVVLAFASVYGLLAFLGIVGGTVGYGVRSFLGYLRTREKYQLNLTRNLYYQNLENNAGVFYRLLNEAEEQELREALLGYFVLWRQAGPNGLARDELDRCAEGLLRELAGQEVDFEVADALAKLRRWELVERDRVGGWRARPIAAALAALDRRWDELFDRAPPPGSAAG